MTIILMIWIIGILWMIFKYPRYADHALVDDRAHRLGYLMASIVWPVILVLGIMNVWCDKKEE
jgi:hypothetical protein